MASSGNRHCVSCIGALSFPIAWTANDVLFLRTSLISYMT